MAKQIIEGAGKYTYHYPRMAVIVTSHAGGKDNAMAVAWHSPLSSKPPLYGIAITSSKTTYELIMEGKGFGVNFVPVEKAGLIAATGGSKGKTVDKFQAFNMIAEMAAKTSVPILQDAYAAYECAFVESKTFGDHEWIVGEIVATYVDESLFDSKGIIDVTKVNPSLYIGGDLYLSTLKDSKKHLDRKVYGGH